MAPQVAGVGSGANLTLTVGDELFLNVSWSDAVVLSSGKTPKSPSTAGAHELWLDAGTPRAAHYYAGNGTNMHSYKYTDWRPFFTFRLF